MNGELLLNILPHYSVPNLIGNPFTSLIYESPIKSEMLIESIDASWD